MTDRTAQVVAVRTPWPPVTEDDLRSAAAVGALEERHHVEVKRELAPGDAANKELAADLASFAVDGGRLIFGIDERNGFALTPIPLAGVAERIESVGRSRVDEPLYLEFTTIRNASDADSGYLVVTVPMSPRAPHMAGNKYWGRGDKTKQPLPDAQVERLIAQRTRWETDTGALLDDLISSDPIGPPNQHLGHLFMVCAPVPRRGDILVEYFGSSWQDQIRRLVANATRPGGAVAPDMEMAVGYLRRTPRGWRGASHQGVRPENEARYIDFEFHEDGEIRLTYGRATDRTEPNKMVVLETACLGMPYRMVQLAALLSNEVPFLGSWDFAISITGLKGAISYLRPYAGRIFEHPVYTASTFRSATRASRQEMEGKPGAIVDRLLGRLVRAIGIDHAPQLQELLGRGSPAP